MDGFAWLMIRASIDSLIALDAPEVAADVLIASEAHGFDESFDRPYSWMRQPIRGVPLIRVGWGVVL